MNSQTITVHAPDDALIVMSINETDGSVGETVLWGPGCEPRLAGVVEAALGGKRDAATGERDGGVDVGWMEVDDRITATVARDGEGDIVFGAEAIGEHLIAFVVAALTSLLAEQSAARQVASVEEGES